jgi:ABC-type bacteriocin/lantibiotic exporter with double-glycine peptidase domain
MEKDKKMRYQSNASSCGPASLRNALLCLRINRTEDELEKLSGFSAVKGTNLNGILKAARYLSSEHSSINPSIIKEGREDVAALKLRASISYGHPCILCVDKDEHWVTVFGMLGELYHVADPADPELVITYSECDLMSRWKGTGKKPYQGVVV